jgi:hypothetical protein
MTASGSYAGRTGHRTNVQTAALVIGAVFALVGILGFIPGITSNYSALGFAGAGSQAALLGIFQVSVLHNIVHLLFGVAGIAMSRNAAQSRNYLIGGGAIYLVLWLYGLLTADNSAANFVPVNSADDWLHFVLGVAMLALGFILSRNTGRTGTTHTV